MPEPTTNNVIRAELRDDEVSLRELYLILRRGLPWILGAAVLAGALAFILTSRRAPIFETNSVVLLSDLPLADEPAANGEAAQPSGSWNGAVPFEAYRELAKSQAVLEDAASRVAGATVSAAQLDAAGRLGDRTRLNRIGEDDPLVFAHIVSYPNPELAAALADAWAMSTLEAVRRLRSATLAEIEAATRTELAQTQDALQAAETQWRDFQAQHPNLLSAQRLEGLNNARTRGEAALQRLEREIAASSARLETLRTQEATSPNPDLRREEVTLSGLNAERESLQAQLRETQRALSQPPTALSARADELRRTVEEAEAALETLNAAQTRTAYLRELVPTTAQRLDHAAVPAAPLGTARTSQIIVAASVGALLALLVLFLRAAILPTPPYPQNVSPTPNSQAKKPLSESRG